jgi:hypothetical protein
MDFEEWFTQWEYIFEGSSTKAIAEFCFNSAVLIEREVCVKALQQLRKEQASGDYSSRLALQDAIDVLRARGAEK